MEPSNRFTDTHDDFRCRHDGRAVHYCNLIKNADTSGLRTGNVKEIAGTSDPSFTLSGLTVGDLVVKMNGSDTGVPPLSSGWTAGQTQTNNGHSVRLEYISAAASTQACNAETSPHNYDGVEAVAFVGTAGGGGGSDTEDVPTGLTIGYSNRNEVLVCPTPTGSQYRSCMLD